MTVEHVALTFTYGNTGQDVIVKIRPDQKLGFAFRKVCERQGLSPSTTSFMLGDQELSPNMNSEDYSLEDGTTIVYV